MNGIQEVEGSIPFVSTRKKARTAEKLYELSAHERAKEKRERISEGREKETKNTVQTARESRAKNRDP